jgi:hypothetical protein
VPLDLVLSLSAIEDLIGSITDLEVFLGLWVDIDGFNIDDGC